MAILIIEDDGDIIRGLGFVTMYSAWTEDDVDDMLKLLKPVEDMLKRLKPLDPCDARKQKWPVSRKLKHVAKLVRRLNNTELNGLLEDLEYGITLFEDRNKVIHGRIFEGFEKKVFLKSGRSNGAFREVSSSELFNLANEFCRYRDNLIGAMYEPLPRAVAQFFHDKTP